MKKYYVVEELVYSKGTLTDTHTYYMGEDLEKAKEKYEDATAEENSKVELQIYNLPDDTDMTDENDIINAINDAACYDTLNNEVKLYEYKKDYKSIGRWWNDSNIELVEIENEVYALAGWNGESYNNSWKCSGACYTEASKEKYNITPVYKLVYKDLDGEGEYIIIDYYVDEK